MGPLGILFWAALVAFELLFLYRNVFLMSPAKPKSD
jgi:hypothetical protein